MHDRTFIIGQLIARLPGTIVTHDVGGCLDCGAMTESGMYKLCVKHLRARAGELLKEEQVNAKP